MFWLRLVGTCHLLLLATLCDGTPQNSVENVNPVQAAQEAFDAGFEAGLLAIQAQSNPRRNVLSKTIPTPPHRILPQQPPGNVPPPPNLIPAPSGFSPAPPGLQPPPLSVSRPLNFPSSPPNPKSTLQLKPGFQNPQPAPVKNLPSSGFQPPQPEFVYKQHSFRPNNFFPSPETKDREELEFIHIPLSPSGTLRFPEQRSDFLDYGQPPQNILGQHTNSIPQENIIVPQQQEYLLPRESLNVNNIRSSSANSDKPKDEMSARKRHIDSRLPFSNQQQPAKPQPSLSGSLVSFYRNADAPAHPLITLPTPKVTVSSAADARYPQPQQLPVSHLEDSPLSLGSVIEIVEAPNLQTPASINAGGLNIKVEKAEPKEIQPPVLIYGDGERLHLRPQTQLSDLLPNGQQQYLPFSTSSGTQSVQPQVPQAPLQVQSQQYQTQQIQRNPQQSQRYQQQPLQVPTQQYQPHVENQQKSPQIEMHQYQKEQQQRLPQEQVQKHNIPQRLPQVQTQKQRFPKEHSQQQQFTQEQSQEHRFPQEQLHQKKNPQVQSQQQRIPQGQPQQPTFPEQSHQQRIPQQQFQQQRYQQGQSQQQNFPEGQSQLQRFPQEQSHQQRRPQGQYQQQSFPQVQPQQQRLPQGESQQQRFPQRPNEEKVSPHVQSQQFQQRPLQSINPNTLNNQNYQQNQPQLSVNNIPKQQMQQKQQINKLQQGPRPNQQQPPQTGSFQKNQPPQQSYETRRPNNPPSANFKKDLSPIGFSKPGNIHIPPLSTPNSLENQEVLQYLGEEGSRDRKLRKVQQSGQQLNSYNNQGGNTKNNESRYNDPRIREYETKRDKNNKGATILILVEDDETEPQTYRGRGPEKDISLRGPVTSRPHSSVAPTKISHSNVTPTKSPQSNATPTKRPYSNVTPIKRPHSNAVPTNGPYSNVTPTKRPHSSVTPATRKKLTLVEDRLREFTQTSTQPPRETTQNQGDPTRNVTPLVRNYVKNEAFRENVRPASNIRPTQDSYQSQRFQQSPPNPRPFVNRPRRPENFADFSSQQQPPEGASAPVHSQRYQQGSRERQRVPIPTINNKAPAKQPGINPDSDNKGLYVTQSLPEMFRKSLKKYNNHKESLTGDITKPTTFRPATYGFTNDQQVRSTRRPSLQQTSPTYSLEGQRVGTKRKQTVRRLRQRKLSGRGRKQQEEVPSQERSALANGGLTFRKPIEFPQSSNTGTDFSNPPPIDNADRTYSLDFKKQIDSPSDFSGSSNVRTTPLPPQVKPYNSLQRQPNQNQKLRFSKPMSVRPFTEDPNIEVTYSNRRPTNQPLRKVPTQQNFQPSLVPHSSVRDEVRRKVTEGAIEPGKPHNVQLVDPITEADQSDDYQYAYAEGMIEGILATMRAQMSEGEEPIELSKDEHDALVRHLQKNLFDYETPVEGQPRSSNAFNTEPRNSRLVGSAWLADDSDILSSSSIIIRSIANLPPDLLARYRIKPKGTTTEAPPQIPSSTEHSSLKMDIHTQTPRKLDFSTN